MSPYKKIVIDKVVPTTIALKNGKELHALIKKETAFLREMNLREETKKRRKMKAWEISSYAIEKGLN